MKRVFVVVPSIRPTSPIKGAAALCNGLAEYLPVTIVPLKTQENAGLCLNPQVKILSLSAYKTWKEKSRVFKDRLKEAGGRDGAVSISLCFSADLFNFFMARQAVILSSVRGNLTRNYSFDYGKLGVLTAVFHYIVLRRFAKVIAMSDAMENELRRFGIRRTVVIGNFIDEAAMESRRVYNHDQTGAVKFVFLGRLSTIKRPDLLLEGLENAKKQGVNCHLDLIGDGPLRNELGNKARTLGLDKNVLFHGHLTDPYSLLQSADYLILPSESEGVSRAVLEALFFGVPCILRNVDANSELITPGKNGNLFSTDEELIELMVNLPKRNPVSGNLLPVKFTQKYNIEKILKIIHERRKLL